MSRVYVGRVPHRARQSDIERFFQGFGRVRDVLMKRGYCFVEFNHSRDAEDAINEMDGKTLCGDRVIVEMARAGRRNDRDRHRHSQSHSLRDRKKSSRRRSRSRSASSTTLRKRRDSRSTSRSASPKQKRKRSAEPVVEKRKPRSPSGSPGSAESDTPVSDRS